MQIIVNGLLTNYQCIGSGKLVVLLHGWGDSSLGLAALQQQLSESYKVLAIDLPGFGKTQVPPVAWGLDEYAAFVAAVLDKLEFTKPYAIIGHSNGGAITIRGCAAGVLQPDKIVLIAAAGVRNTKGMKRSALKVVAKTGNVATIWLPHKQRQKLRQKLYGSVGSDILAVPELQDTFKKSVRQDVQADAKRLTQPTLLIYGDKDTAVPIADGRLFASIIPQSRLEVLHGVGHFVHLERPQEVTKIITEFLA